MPCALIATPWAPAVREPDHAFDAEQGSEAEGHDRPSRCSISAGVPTRAGRDHRHQDATALRTAVGSPAFVGPGPRFIKHASVDDALEQRLSSAPARGLSVVSSDVHVRCKKIAGDWTSRGSRPSPVRADVERIRARDDVGRDEVIGYPPRRSRRDRSDCGAATSPAPVKKRLVGLALSRCAPTSCPCRDQS